MRPPALVFGCSRRVHGGKVVVLARPKGHGIVVVSRLAADIIDVRISKEGSHGPCARSEHFWLGFAIASFGEAH